MTAIEFIKNWADTKKSFSFFLPTGAVGRPLDTQYKLIEVLGSDNRIVIKLSEDTTFIFHGEKINVREDSCNLLITNFDDFQYQVGNKPIGNFTSGEFCLVGF